jgi:hypothetical protein
VSAVLSPAARLDQYIAEDRLIRGKWMDGKTRACLLATLAPECGEAQSAAVCPAEIMPAWLAHLTPWLDDAGSEAAWPAMVRRYAALAHRWHVLTPEAWRRLDYAARAICVREAVTHTTDAQAIAACETVLALCDRAAGGDLVTEAEWSAARAVAGVADRITAAILSAIEDACAEAEVQS